MASFYEFNAKDTASVVAILAVSIGYSIYWFLSISAKVKKWFFLRFTEDRAWITYVLFQKIAGLLFMGVLPGIVVVTNTTYSFSDLGVNLFHLNESLLYIAIIGVLIVTLNFFASKNQNNLNMYPQMRIASWTKRRIAINSLSWAIYFVGYEFMYRGLLLMICYHSFGFWPALAINLSFYATTHIAKGLTETIATFPYGFILCFATISTGSILVAYTTHLILALSNDFSSVFHQPQMNFNMRGSTLAQKMKGGGSESE
ncbi:MAG: CPBP family intramembrane metalloprotease [bacterium]|nr:CPBP family intramembrane metalloprotease [bacterium]